MRRPALSATAMVTMTVHLEADMGGTEDHLSEDTTTAVPDRRLQMRQEVESQPGNEIAMQVARHRP